MPAALEDDGDWARLRHALALVARDKHEWAGIPMPIDGAPLVIEPNFPGAAELAQIGLPEGGFVCHNDDVDESVCIRNRFWSWRWRSDILVCGRTERSGVDEHGCYTYRQRVSFAKVPAVVHTAQMLGSLSVADAWGLDQEDRALQFLQGLIPARQMRQYLLTGMFAERSRRSDITYIFRRLRPTLAISCHHKDERPRVIAALCQHPIAYYAGSWAGAMVPTDDVVAHLMLMRGDEAMFWRRSNQHPAWRPEAGVG